MPVRRASEVCKAVEEYMARYQFTAFITLTLPNDKRPHREVPHTVQSRLDKLMAAFQKRWRVSAGGFGVCTLSYSGHLHLHLVALKEDGELFSEKELAWIKRRWPHNTDARPVYGLPHLLEYIASAKHITECKTWEPAFCGDSVLKSRCLS